MKSCPTEVCGSKNCLEAKQDITSTIHKGNQDKKRCLNGQTFTYSDIFSILGLQSSFRDDFTRLPSDIKYHLNEGSWALIFLESNYKAIKEDTKRHMLNEEFLDKIGFERDSNAVKTMLLRSKLLRNSVEPIDVVKRFIVDELKYNPALASSCELATEDYFQEQKAELKIIRVDTIDAMDLIMKDMATDKDLSQGCSLLFHGTDIKSADDISSGGIAVSAGSQKRDFSDGRGFYLFDNFKDAENWAFSITQKPVVLIFKIPKSCLEKANFLNLSRESSEIQWKEIVDANRSGILDKEIRKTLKEYDGIEGPCTGLCETDSLVDSRQSLPNTYQLCITNEDFADEISEYLSAVVVYERI